MTINNSKKSFLSVTSLGAVIISAAIIGAAITYGVVYLTEDTSSHQEQITVLENKINALDILLAQKEEELSRMRSVRSGNAPQTLTAANNNAESLLQSHQKVFEKPVERATNSVPMTNTQQALKDLATRNDFNPRSFSERITDFLSTNPGEDNIAIAAKAVADMADNKDALPNIELEAVYQKQTDPDLKRVTAQVLSLRGDNSLLEKQISDSQAGLKSDNPEIRQQTLVALAKTHYAGAADKIASLLQDKDIGVKLDALLALRATGNENHVRWVQDLVRHPDPSVSWLANDVINNIQNLSAKARTKLSASEIVAELPPIMSQ
jgi:HEAT repeat protein